MCGVGVGVIVCAWISVDREEEDCAHVLREGVGVWSGTEVAVRDF